VRADEPSRHEAPIFELDELVIGFRVSARTAIAAVRGVSFAVRRGETLGIVGESGSGKSASLMGAFGLLPSGAVQLGGTVRLAGRDVGALSAEQRRRLLGKEVAFIFQNPVASLDPVLSIGDQLVEALRIHDLSLGRQAAWQRAVELLGHVGIETPEVRARQYPHEFSGGMCQRAVIAMALANRPQVLIADEPTTAVDATIQAQILKLLRDLRAEVSGAVVLVSHDLGVIAENTDHMVVMYAGRVMESGPTMAVLASPRHPYTQGLLACRPLLHQGGGVAPIPGNPPELVTDPPGCAFRPRCPLGRNEEICAVQRPPLAASGDSLAACHFAGEAAFARNRAPVRRPGGGPRDPLFRLRGITVEFPLRGSLFGKRRTLRAVSAVSMDLHRGEALGVVGESGSGKSTLARVMMRLVDATSGALSFDGTDLTHLGRSRLHEFRKRVQMVFQDSFNSLNPRLTAGDNAAEPLRLRGIPPAQRRQRVLARFAEVGLEAAHYDRDIAELSGGQLQRVGIARALMLDPEVLVMDEPVSALDVSVQAQILNLLAELRSRRRLSYVFISHDMAVVRHLCDRVAVMNRGEVVELGDADTLFERPASDYTRKLLSAVPKVTALTP
jgi:peptide/nickel transport system ATP-binding protein